MSRLLLVTILVAVLLQEAGTASVSQITGVRGQDCAWSCVLPQPWDKATQPCTPGSDQGNREAHPFLARGTGGQAQLPHSCQALMLHCGHWSSSRPKAEAGPWSSTQRWSGVPEPWSLRRKMTSSCDCSSH
ncbi:proline-rich acidic protein 1 isoform X2 [Equus asinus]|uniref:proline-rich acidic protein 1 isoform X2 n=1 Tax=Equus asinus TaxID=9793 RepID=UPI0038F7F53B